MQVFSEEWFERHQDTLLSVLNDRPFRRWSRWLLRISRHDCPIGTDITQLGPNRFSYGDRRVVEGGRVSLLRTTDFRCNDKFSRRLYHGLHPLWRTMHAWDAMLANRLAPALNLGFDTLTAYPSYPVTNTCDGVVGQDGGLSTWHNIRITPGNVALTSFGSNNLGGYGEPWIWTTDPYSPVSFTSFTVPLYLFDTSSLGAGSTILGAVESLYWNTTGAGWLFNLPYASFTVVSSSPASNTVINFGDIATLGTVPFCDTPLPINSVSLGYNSWAFNMAGLAAISKIGITKTAIRDVNYDLADVPPSDGGSWFSAQVGFSSVPGTSFDPRLVITYMRGGAVPWGFESPYDVRSRPPPPAPAPPDAIPAIKFPKPGIWGQEQSLPPPHQIPTTRCEPVVALPAPQSLPALKGWGWDLNLPPLRPIPKIQAESSLSQVSISPPALKPWAFEPILPPAYRKPYPQAGPIDILPRVPRMPWGWEPLRAPQYRAPLPQAGPVYALGRIPIQPWGYEHSLPAPYRMPIARSPYADVLPALRSGRSGWETPAYPPSFQSRPKISTFDALPASLSPWGWDNHVPPVFRIRTALPAPFDTPPGLVTEIWGWESSAPSPYRLPPVLPMPGHPLPSLLAGLAGWESPGLPSAWRYPVTGQSIDISPPIFKDLWGWEPPSPLPRWQPTSQLSLIDVLPSLLAGIAGWEAPGIAQAWRSSFPGQPSDISPPILKEIWGWEPPSPLPHWQPSPQPSPIEAFPSLLAGLAGWDPPGLPPVWRTASPGQSPDVLLAQRMTAWGWEMAASPLSRIPIPPSASPDILAPLLAAASGWELPGTLPNPRLPLRQQISDGYPLPPALSGPWGWQDESPILQRSHRAILSFDDWWPGIQIPNRTMPGGGYKPWYGWQFPEAYEDDDLRQRLEREIEAIDAQLDALADEPDAGPDHDARIIIPDVLPPGWQAGDDDRGYGRGRPQDPYRHVHYNFASDLDFGVRRRILGILDRAEHRRVNIFGSEAFKTREGALVKGRFVERGTDAWVLRLDSQARLEIAREAIAEGFKLVSFDDTSLSFIHRPTFPWKPVLLGAGAGAAIMGAGVFTGWLIWGRKPRLPS